MTRRDARSASYIAFGKAGLFDQPRCRELYSARAISGWKLRRLLSRRSADRLRLLFADDRILEETSRAAVIGISFDEEHAFGSPNPSHRIRHFQQAGIRLPRKLSLQIPIGDGRHCAKLKPIVDSRDHVAPAIYRIEAAAAIRKSALGGGEIDKDASAQIIGADLIDAVGDLLPVGANILHRRAACRSRNSRQALNSSTSVIHRSMDEAIPIFSRRNPIDGAIPFVAPLDSLQANAHRQAFKTGIDRKS